jgi:putative SOS response-associated peptidase YedK
VDGGTTNVRTLNFPYWKRWFGVEHRCLVPVTSCA